MQKITMKVTDNNIHIDFDGFPGDTCSDEEDALLFFINIMGLKTNVKRSDNKQDKEKNGIKNTNRTRN